jgi:SAM-dependent methyltransferase
MIKTSIKPSNPLPIRAATTPEHCAICRAQGHISFLCDSADYHVYRCDACDGDFVHPIPSEEFLAQFYSREEWFEGGEPGGYQNYDEQTVGSVLALQGLLRGVATGGGTVLDVGCGYGTHLQLAAASGWTCSGVEISDHARAIAQQRLGAGVTVVAKIADLSTEAYDLVLLLDVIEHLGDPYPLFAELVSRGAFTAATRLVVTTPNAGSDEAVTDPANWQYRHPPSHLTYYSARAMTALMTRLGFTKIEVEGPHALRPERQGEIGMGRFAGLLATASGFDPTRLSFND